MATTYTELLQLPKHDTEDPFDITLINDMADLVDAGVAKVYQERMIRNMFINSFFLGNRMINSRGVTAPISTPGMMFDGWRINAGTWDWNETGLIMTASGNIQQRVTNDQIAANTAHTLAIYYADGGVSVVNYNALPEGASGSYYYINIIPELNRSIAAFGLYPGRYTAESVPSYVYNGLENERLACMTRRRIVPVLFGADINSDGREIIRIDPPMRVAPSVENITASGGADAAISVGTIREYYIDATYTSWGTGFITLNAEP